MPKAIRFHKAGGPDVLVLEDVDPGAPGPGEALVEHAAIGLNFIDTYHRSGLYPLPLPSGLGSEAAGTVRAIGVSFGQSSGPVPPFEPALINKKGSLFFTRPSLHHYTETREELAATAAALFDVVARGIVKIDVRQEYPLAEASRAHADLESRKTRGPSILLP